MCVGEVQLNVCSPLVSPPLSASFRRDSRVTLISLLGLLCFVKKRASERGEARDSKVDLTQQDILKPRKDVGNERMKGGIE